MTVVAGLSLISDVIAGGLFGGLVVVVAAAAVALLEHPMQHLNVAFSLSLNSWMQSKQPRSFSAASVVDFVLGTTISSMFLS